MFGDNILSEKSKSLKPSATMSVAAKAAEMKRQGKQIIDFSVGEPDFDTPDSIKQAGINAIKEGKTKYTEASGIPELRKAVCERLKKDDGLVYSPEQVLITSGGKLGIYTAFLAVLNEGDEVIIPSPYWVSYIEQVKLVGGVPIVAESEDNRITADSIAKKVSRRTKMIVLNYPCNPTGFTISGKELRKISQIAVKNKILILSDEVYNRLSYTKEKHVSIASMDSKTYDLTLTMNSLSKTYAMTGWRVGYIAGPKEIISAMGKIQSQIASGPCSISQYAALAALKGSQASISRMVAEFRKRRDFAVKKINECKGIKCISPEGAFYIFIDIAGTGIKSIEFSEKLLEKKLVAVVPGMAFGNDDFVRLSFAASRKSLEEGMKRLKEFCAEVNR